MENVIFDRQSTAYSTRPIKTGKSYSGTMDLPIPAPKSQKATANKCGIFIVKKLTHLGKREIFAWQNLKQSILPFWIAMIFGSLKNLKNKSLFLKRTQKSHLFSVMPYTLMKAATSAKSTRSSNHHAEKFSKNCLENTFSAWHLLSFSGQQ